MADMFTYLHNALALKQAAVLIHGIPVARWQIAFSVDFEHQHHLRFSASAEDGREIAVIRQSAMRMLGDIVVEETDVYHLIVGTHVFENEGMCGRTIQKIYDELCARLHPGIVTFLEAQRAEARRQAMGQTE